MAFPRKKMMKKQQRLTVDLEATVEFVEICYIYAVTYMLYRCKGGGGHASPYCDVFFRNILYNKINFIKLAILIILCVSQFIP